MVQLACPDSVQLCRCWFVPAIVLGSHVQGHVSLHAANTPTYINDTRLLIRQVFAHTELKLLLVEIKINKIFMQIDGNHSENDLVVCWKICFCHR